jgi:hypothetical protein
MGQCNAMQCTLLAFNATISLSSNVNLFDYINITVLFSHPISSFHNTSIILLDLTKHDVCAGNTCVGSYPVLILAWLLVIWTSSCQSLQVDAGIIP